MTWNEIAISNLQAAKDMIQEHPRSSTSRSYYAAHVALAGRLIDSGYAPPVGRQTQPHVLQPRLMKKYLRGFGPNAVRQLQKAFNRLYARRIDADYKRNVTLDRGTALDSLRDASSVLTAFGVNEG